MAFYLIKRFRNVLGISQADMARLMKVNKNTVARWETGKRRMSPQSKHSLRCLIESYEKTPELYLPKKIEEKCKSCGGPLGFVNKYSPKGGSRHSLCKLCKRTRAYLATFNHRKKYPIKSKRVARKWQAANKGKLAGYYRKHYEKNKKKYAAVWKIAESVQRGETKREVCKLCGKKKAEGHHYDYDKPLEVIWLCKKHHAAWHKVFLADGV
jgi:transcriptional regulator with XRE-family HTH domain